MKIIGITGSVGSGKSMVSNILVQKNYRVYDYEEISKQIIQYKQSQMFHLFGEKIIEDGEINRHKLRKLIMSNRSARLKFHKIIHPEICKYFFREIFKCFLLNEPVVFIVVPMFFELNLQRYFDSILVYCDDRSLKNRVARNDLLELENLTKKMQIPIEKKMKMATWVVNNTNSILDTEIIIDSIDFGGTELMIFVLLFIFTLLLLHI
ncbi:dephospho-CoA kinase [Edhazardia aedis USNM 41457]|uniref:Dephospho-CoA kinase n=1 Tax=Edhazardia aedis (strain USNM 41457) TaxID=1003232 RepID=J8ZV25_EDHAE|nr:dephospho-CoA kinase [Edhazardia aedis USNM 41457]|eukprot:EJW03523.1 dephospho-CoA kinase [Edhazardia aedis USNM 41457]